MEYRRLVVVLELALSVCACGGGSPPPSPTQPTPPTIVPPPPTPTPSTVTLTGTVIAANTGGGLYGATIRILDGVNEGRTATANPNGEYRLDNLQVGSANLSAAASGYQETRAGVDVNGTNKLDFTLQPVLADWPREVAAVLNRGLLVPPGLYLYWTLDTGVTGSGCPGGKTPGQYNTLLRRVEMYADWRKCFGGTYSEMLGWTTHEVCHAHQQRILLDAGLPDTNLSTWVETTEGMAFMAAGGRSSLPSNPPSGDPKEDFANICSAWYMRRDYLRQHDRAMYTFAQAWLPQ